MEQLPQTYKANGIKFHQLDRSDYVAIYESKESSAFEVFQIKYQKPEKANIGNRLIEFKEKEKEPNNEEFGKIAWAYSNRDKAYGAFEHLKKKIFQYT